MTAERRAEVAFRVVGIALLATAVASVWTAYHTLWRAQIAQGKSVLFLSSVLLLALLSLLPGLSLILLPRPVCRPLKVPKTAHESAPRRKLSTVDIQCTIQFSKLVAYALENYLKAVIVHRNPKKSRNRWFRRLPRCLEEHDLVRLAGRAGLELQVTEEELLVRLSRAAVWGARYPTPTEPGGTNPMHTFSNRQTYLIAYFAPADPERLSALVGRVRRYVTGQLDDQN